MYQVVILIALLLHKQHFLKIFPVGRLRDCALSTKMTKYRAIPSYD